MRLWVAGDSIIWQLPGLLLVSLSSHGEQLTVLSLWTTVSVVSW